jgi:hypothetical protein
LLRGQGGITADQVSRVAVAEVRTLAQAIGHRTDDEQ